MSIGGLASVGVFAIPWLALMFEEAFLFHVIAVARYPLARRRLKRLCLFHAIAFARWYLAYMLN